MVKIRLVRDDGPEFIIDNIKWKIYNDGLEGFSGVENDIKTQNRLNGDGVDFISERVPEKDRTIQAKLIDRSLNKQMRKKVSDFLLPKHDYKCYLNYDGNEVYCEGRLYSYSLPTDNIYNGFLELTIVLLSDTPYIYKDHLKVKLKNGDNSVLVGGTIKPDFRLYIEGKTLPQLNISINEEPLKINANLSPSDTLLISNVKSQLRVYKNNQLAMGLVDVSNSFTAKLDTGLNFIRTNVDCDIEIREVYTAL